MKSLVSRRAWFLIQTEEKLQGLVENAAVLAVQQSEMEPLAYKHWMAPVPECDILKIESISLDIE